MPMPTSSTRAANASLSLVGIFEFDGGCRTSERRPLGGFLNVEPAE